MRTKSNGGGRLTTRGMTGRGGAAQRGGPAERELSAEREGAVRVAAFALPDERVLRSRRLLASRLAWLDQLQRAAARDEDRLVTVPLDPEPNLSREEIAELGDRIALLGRIDGYYHRARTTTRARLADEGHGVFA